MAHFDEDARLFDISLKLRVGFRLLCPLPKGSFSKQSKTSDGRYPN
jgi:hypothetical protein